MTSRRCTKHGVKLKSDSHTYAHVLAHTWTNDGSQTPAQLHGRWQWLGTLQWGQGQGGSGHVLCSQDGMSSASLVAIPSVGFVRVKTRAAGMLRLDVHVMSAKVVCRKFFYRSFWTAQGRRRALVWKCNSSAGPLQWSVWVMVSLLPSSRGARLGRFRSLSGEMLLSESPAA